MSSIKIRREVFAAKLQERLDASEKNRAKFESESEKQKIKMAKAIQTFMTKAVKTKGLTYSAHINWRNTLSLTIENAPVSLLEDIQNAEHPIDCEPMLSAWEKSEIEAAIRLLQLSEDEYISASFSKKFSKYL